MWLEKAVVVIIVQNGIFLQIISVIKILALMDQIFSVNSFLKKKKKKKTHTHLNVKSIGGGS